MNNTSYPSECFLCELNDYAVGGVEESVWIGALVNGVYVLEGTFFPDENNEVVIRDLKNLVLPFFSDAANVIGRNDTNVELTINANFSQDGGQHENDTGFTTKVFKSPAVANVEFSRDKSMFLSRRSKILTNASRRESISFLDNYHAIRCNIAVLENGMAKYYFVFSLVFSDQDSKREAVSIDTSLSSVFYDFNMANGEENDINDVLFYDIACIKDDMIVDSIRYEVDKRNFQTEVQFAFVNMFGIYEFVTFTGQTEDKVDFSSDLQYINGAKVKVDDEHSFSRKINSGFLNKKEYLTVKDMILSNRVKLVEDDGSLVDIVITEAEFSDKRPANIPYSCSIAYTRADDEHKFSKDYVSFDRNIFDASFDNAFD